MAVHAVERATGWLQPFVPRLVLDWERQAPGATWRELSGSMAFVDISGFTAMTERLARRGRVGAEEMNDILNTLFTQLLGVAYDDGAGLVKWGGDAVLLVYQDDDHAARACRAAANMQRTIRRIGHVQSVAGRARLRMSVGIHSGTFHFYLVGDPEIHRELIVAGPGSTRTTQMEQIAEATEVVVSPETAALLDPSVVGPAKDEGFLLAGVPDVPFRSAPPSPDVSGVDLGRFIPTAIRRHLIQDDLEPEHRRIVPSFIEFGGSDDMLARRGADAVAASIDECVRVLQRATERNGVTFFQTDISKDAWRAFLIAGCPRSLGQDEDRMLETLREIVETRLPFTVKIGVNAGPVFAAYFGPPFRKTYDVKGDAVNLAARLMAKAGHGQILATAAVLDPSTAVFELEPLEPFAVKGKKLPIQAWSVGRRIGSKSAGVEFPLVGRDAEIAAFRRALRELRAGHSSMIELVGNPGMGKTRLLEELRSEAPDLPHLLTNCEPYEASVSYLPFRRLLRLLIGHATGDDGSEEARQLREDVRKRAPQLLPWLPLLAIVADVDVPMTAEVQDLGEEFRRNKLEEVTTEYLSLVVTVPTLVTIEDAHWMDEGSADLLRSIAGRIGRLPWLVCVSRRDEETGFVVPDAPGCVSLRLAPLTEDALENLINVATEDAPFPRHEVAELRGRSGGNPLFLQELLHAARIAGSVSGLPDSIEGMVTAEIDRLATPDRRVLRYASVLGVSFDASLLEAVLEEDSASMHRSVWERLTPFVQSEGHGRYRFRHALMRDAAYEGLPYRRRRELHARVGNAILGASGPAADEQAELLSLHFFLAGDFDRAWRYSTIAAEHAEAAYANIEASRFLRRAIDASRRLDVPNEELLRTNERLGDVLERAGLYEGAAKAYAEARRVNGADRIAETGLILKQAKLADKAGKPSSSLRWITRALRLLEGIPERDAAAQRARLSATYSIVRAGQGRAAEAIRWAERAISEAEEVGEREALANAHFMIAWTRVNRGEMGQEFHFERALSLFEELGDVKRQGDVLTYFGAMAYWEGRWREAVELYERGGERSQRAGDVVGAAIASMNIAEIRSDQGRLGEAEAPARKALRVFRAARYSELIATDSSILGRIASRAGRHDEAAELLAEALRRAEESGGRLLTVGAIGFLAEGMVRRGDGEAALEHVRRAQAQAALIGGAGVYEPLLERVKGCAHLIGCDFAEAKEALGRSLVAARAAGSGFEVLLALDSKRALSDALGEQPSSSDVAEAASIADRLGIVSIPGTMPESN